MYSTLHIISYYLFEDKNNKILSLSMMTRNDTPNNYVGILNSPKYIPLNPSSPNHDNSKTEGTVCLGILSHQQCLITQSMLSKSNAFMFCCFEVFVWLLTLARTVKPASVTCEQRAASRILRKTHAMWMNDSVWVCVLICVQMKKALLEPLAVEAEGSQRSVCDVAAARHTNHLQFVTTAAQTHKAVICNLLQDG